MNAHAGNGGGTFTWTGGGGGQSGVTVTGNNNNVNVGSGNQQASTGGGGNNNAGNNNNDNADKPQFSQEIFDYVELRLQYFADATKKIADKITDYVTNATKGKLLRSEVTALQNEIKANSRAATTYKNFAEELAKAYVYTDKDGNKQTVNIWSKFNQKDLLEGKYNLEQIETTNPNQAAFVEGARAYLDYINKSRDANNAIQELANTMRDLQGQIIQLPTEKLEKSLEKIENRINTISGITSAISGGKSGIASAQRWIEFATGVKAQKDVVAKSTADRSTKLQNYNDAKSKYENRKDLTQKSKTELEKYLKANTKVSKNDKNSILNAMKKGELIPYNKNRGDYFKKRVDDYNNKIKKEAAAKTAKENADKAYKAAKKQNQSDKNELKNLQDTSYGQANVLMESSLYKPSYIAQNENIDKEMRQLKEELKKRRTAMEEQQEITTQFASQQASLQKESDKAKKSILSNSAYKKASKSEKDFINKALNNGWKIDPTRVSNELGEAVALWNNARASLENVTGALGQAREQEQKMKEELIQSAVEVAEREQKIAQEKMDNIESWYQAAINLSKTWAERREEIRKVWKERGYYIAPDQLNSAQPTFKTNGKNVGESRLVYSVDRGYYIATKNENGEYVRNTNIPRTTLLTDGISYSYNQSGKTTIEKGSPIDSLKSNYEGQIDQLKKVQKAYANQAKAQQELLDKFVKAGTILENSEKHKAMMTNIQKANIEVYKLDEEINNLYDDMRQDVYFKPLEDMIKNIDTVRKALDQLKGTISPEMMYTTDGTFTELGTAKYAMDVRSYKMLQDQFTKIRTAQQVLTNRLREDPSLDIETYNSKMKEYEAQSRDVITSLASQRQTIIKDVTDRYQTEITYINKLIDAKKNELNKRKELYDYDKKLRKQNKDVQLIEQQIRALNGLTDAESRAQKARLEAQRAEMQEELDDTVKDHIVNLRIDGLTDLSAKLQENYEKYVKDLSINIDHAAQLVVDSATNLKASLGDVNASFNAYLKSFHPDAFQGEQNMGVPQMVGEDLNVQYKYVEGVNLSSSKIRKKLDIYKDNLSQKEYDYWQAMKSEAAKISEQVGDLNDMFRRLLINGDFSGGKLGEEYLSGGLAKGTKSAKPGLYQINENGPEAIVTRRGVMLMPLRAGDGVIPADLTENLMAMAKSGMVPVQTPNFQAPEYNINHSTNQNITIHYDNLIRIDGNADQSIVPQLEEIAKGLMNSASFKKNIYNYTTKEIVKDMRKAGH